jgi:tetratricopeptide (TPR) repeat protein
MNYLVLHIDLEFIVGAVCADNGNSYPVTNGKDDLLWLYFFNNPHQGKISFGKENRTHFNNREINYYGRFFELTENEQETFSVRSIPKQAIELLDYSELLKTLKEKYEEITHEKPDNIPTLLTFSLSIGELAKQKTVEYLKNKGFQIDSYTIPLSELVCYYPYSKKDFIPANGNTVLLLAATNSTLHLMKLIFSNKYFMLDSKVKSYDGKGMDPRKRALVKYVVNELHNVTGALPTEKEKENECNKLESKAEEWLKRLDSQLQNRPFRITESPSKMPSAKKDVFVRKANIESDTGHYIQELMDIFDAFKSDNVHGDVAAIFLLGDCFHNSLVLEKFKNQIAKEKLFVYSNRNIRDILSVYPKIDFNRYISEEARIKAKAKSDELKKAEQRALEDKKRKEKEAEDRRIAAEKKAEANREEAQKLHERAIALDKEGKLQDAIANIEKAVALDKDNTEYQRLFDILEKKQKELVEKTEKYKSWLKDAEEYEQSGELNIALKAYKNAQEIFDSAELRRKIVAIENRIEQQQRDAERRAEIEKQYKTLIQHAKACFSKEAYDTALSKYAEALDIKPDDAYCLEQIKIINDLILQKQNLEKAQAIVADADKLFGKELWEDAKRKYAEALKFCPADTTIQSKVKECDAKIKAIDDAFNDLLGDANIAEAKGTKEKLEEALELLKKAEKIRPENADVKRKIEKINNKLKLADFGDGKPKGKFLKKNGDFDWTTPPKEKTKRKDDDFFGLNKKDNRNKEIQKSDNNDFLDTATKTKKKDDDFLGIQKKDKQKDKKNSKSLDF